jgi:ubiquinone/menaquinone biosynthesis C-methylase UbiE
MESRVLSDEATRAEEKKLRKSWAKFTPDVLEEYLVTGYQNPRINAQSILARHFFVRHLFGSEFDELMKEELEFCVDANEAIRQRARELGVEMGAFTDPGKRAAVQRVCEVIADRERTFERRWQEALAGKAATKPISVLEFACGSANDYRSFADYGLARFLRYTGVDLNELNIANAKRRFPGVKFEVGSILSLPYRDGAFEYVLAFDIFEHLSLSAMDDAMDEAIRLAGKGLVLGFFIMISAPEHNERPRAKYHWNELSAGKIEEKLRKRFAEVQVIHLQSFLKENYGFARYYNKKAYTIIAQSPL